MAQEQKVPNRYTSSDIHPTISFTSDFFSVHSTIAFVLFAFVQSSLIFVRVYK